MKRNALGCVLGAAIISFGSLAGTSCRPSTALPPTPWTAAAIAHAGAGTNPGRSDGCRAAVDAALAVLDAGGNPVDAAVAGVVVMEDDPRFNAGTGSRVRIDGETVQMDASVMDSEGRFAAVAAIERVKNPVKVARAVLDSPHLVLAGEGATRFARTLGMEDFDPRTPESAAKAEKVRQQLRSGDASLAESWKTFDWRARWNFPRSVAETGMNAMPTTAVSPAETPAAANSPAPSPGSDTVGVAVRSRDGRFAVALSTGGTSITLYGRVGDVPVYGAGLFAGSHGASAATGTGERIIETALAREVDGWLRSGIPAEDAAKRAVARVQSSAGRTTRKPEIGIIVLGPREMAAASVEPMAWAGREAGSGNWEGPVPLPSVP